MDLLDYAPLGAIYLTFAVAVGVAAYEARASLDRGLLLVAALLGALVFLPLHLALPETLHWTFPLRFVGLALALLYTGRPGRLPAWLWSPRFLYQGLGLSMASISLWGIARGPGPAGPILGLLAALAAGLAWGKVGLGVPGRAAGALSHAGRAPALVFPLALGGEERIGAAGEVMEDGPARKGGGQGRIRRSALADGDEKRRPQKRVR